MSVEIQLDLIELISSQEGSLVSPIVPQENKIQTTIANSGMKCLELSKKSDPPTSLERMSEILLASEKEWYSNKCVLTWKVKATKCRRMYYQLQQSTRRTKDTGVGLWPTPRVADTEGGLVKNVEINKGSFSRVNKDGVRWGVKLKDAVNHMENKMWPTPAAHEGRLGYQRRDTGKKGTQKSLTTIVIDSQGGREKTTGQLNPQWVEWLMGYPIGWTDLKD